MSGWHPGWLIAAGAALSLAPFALAFGSSYLKINLVLQVLRQGIGAGNVPGPAVVTGLSMILSFYAMAPVLASIGDELGSLRPEDMRELKLPEMRARAARVSAPWKSFLLRHSGKLELARVAELEDGAISDRAGPQDLPLRMLMLAFALTELKEGFAMALALLLPFLVIDLAVANLLAGMGMFMLSPQLISLPLKLLLMLSTDGWLMISRSLIESYR